MIVILEELARYPESYSSAVNQLIGAEISAKTAKRALDALVKEGLVAYTGEWRWRHYWLPGIKDR